MKYHFKYHKDKNGYWAECVELKGCVTQADTLLELKTNAQEALNLYLDEPDDSQKKFAWPQKNITKKNVFNIPVDTKIALAVTLRNLRLQDQLTQKDIAQKMGFKNIYSYQRLESSKTANPELMTLVKLKEIFPSMSIDSLI